VKDKYQNTDEKSSQGGGRHNEKDLYVKKKILEIGGGPWFKKVGEAATGGGRPFVLLALDCLTACQGRILPCFWPEVKLPYRPAVCFKQKFKTL